jgi:diguanylate cyclase (GGDEF)-like protein
VTASGAEPTRVIAVAGPPAPRVGGTRTLTGPGPGPVLEPGAGPEDSLGSSPSPESSLDVVLDAVASAVVVHRHDGSLAAVNPAARRLLAGLPESVLRSAVLPLTRTATDGPARRFTLTSSRPDGSRRRLLATAVPLPAGPGSLLDDAAVVTTVRDLDDIDPTDDHGGTVPDPAVLRQRLALAERRLRATLESSPVGIAVFAPDGRLLQANQAMLRLWRGEPDLAGSQPSVSDPAGSETAVSDVGLPQHPAITWAGSTHPDDLAAELQLVATVTAGHQDGYRLDKRWLRADGSEVFTHTSVAVVRDDPAAGEGVGAPAHFVVQVHDLTATRQATERLAHRSLYDPLTGLANRTLCLDRIQQGLDRRHRTSSQIAVLLCDLDAFALVNDSMGPEHGDLVLRQVAQRLASTVARALPASATTTVARLAGDEFAVVLEDVDREAQALNLAELLVAAVHSPVDIGGRQLVPTACVGIAVSTNGHTDAHTLLRDAGSALHRAKRAGRGTWDLVDDDLRERALARFELEGQLRTGIGAGQLRLHVQPIVDLSSGAVVGREALVRWQHPERGLLPPAEFLQVAEESSLMNDLGRWVMDEAARIAAACPDQGYIAVNVSPTQVRRPGLVADVEAALATHHLSPSALVVELTESAVLDGRAGEREQLGQLSDLGVRLVVDDFGTGFSALSHLRDLPVSGIKIDRSFTQGLGEDPQCHRIIESLTHLAKGLQVDLVAEGVETEDQAMLLADMGCRHAQGYLFGRPAPAAT